jgi:hypothetical protein
MWWQVEDVTEVPGKSDIVQTSQTSVQSKTVTVGAAQVQLVQLE